MSIKNEIIAACNILRRDDGTNATVDYMEQLSWMLFLKTFESVEEELEELAILENKPYNPIIDKKFRWSNWAREKDWLKNPKECLAEFVEDVDEEFKKIIDPDNTLIYFIDYILFPYLRNLKGTPEKEKIAQIFKEISGNKVKSIYNLLDVIAKIDPIDPKNYEDTHILSQVYEELLLQMGTEAGWGGEFYTPRPVIRFIINVIKPKLGETILDPFGGSAGFLVEAYKYLLQTTPHITVEQTDILKNKTLFGHEKKPLPFLLGTMNLILHGITNPNYYRKNTFSEDILNIPDNEKYHIILTNPPFGGKEGKQIPLKFPYPISATEALALQYIMRKLKRGGRVGMVLPEGQIMFGEGKFKEIRQELLEKFNVFAIVSLPQGVFSVMGAGVKTNLVFFEKTGEPTKEIWYYELEGKFTKTQKIQDKHFEDALNKIEKREISEHSWIVPIEEIREKNYDLTAKNPNKKDETNHKEPKEIVYEIESLNYEIEKILKEVKNLI